MEAVCTHCTQVFRYKPSVSTGKFCSNKCQGEAKSARLLNEWLSGSLDAISSSGQLRLFVKKWVKTRDNYRCVLCGWGEKNPVTGISPVEVDHVNGDHLDSRPENLRTLCPNCHSLTATWKNTGNTRANPRGREYRRKQKE